MEVFEKKSAENTQAAKSLIETHALYNPSVHCSYYSCVQYMLLVLCSISGVYNLPTREKREAQIRKELGEWEEKGFHIKLTNRIFQEFPPETTDKVKFDFKSSVRELKSKRVECDYSEVAVEELDSKKALKMANDINQTLKNEFEI